MDWLKYDRNTLQQLYDDYQEKGYLIDNIINLVIKSYNAAFWDDIYDSALRLRKGTIEEIVDGVDVAYPRSHVEEGGTIEEIVDEYENMLPEDLQQIIRESRLDQFSLEELELAADGRTYSVLKKEYFIPDDPYKFGHFANIRGMSVDEYCLCLTGKEYSSVQETVTDEKIIEFLNSHYTNVNLMIPLKLPQWFRSFISRSGYSMDEIAELYGYADSQNQENDVQRLETTEDDMQKYNIASEDWLDRLYAENPLIGNEIISEKEKEELFYITKGYIDERLRNPSTKFNLKIKMEITLAIITYAKKWDTGDESGFWRYITSQFGYRDDTGQLRGILCDCVLEAMQKNRRWFLTSATRSQYKSTIVVHALTTERSWMHFYEFLFDFYKTNMEWTYIKDDPSILRMVSALRGKLIAEDEAENENLEISSNVYSFREGIRKLIIYRTRYAVQIISRMLERIHGIISHTEKPAELYVDLLCNHWIESKLRNANEVRNRECNIVPRNVAIDYTRIRPQYSLSDETSPVIVLPDVRLKKTDFNKVELKVYTGNVVVESKPLSFYGNELGKTLKGFVIHLDDKFMRRGDGSLNIRVVLSCDDEEFFDSRESLYRECLCFSKGKECDIKKTVKGSYSIFAPSTVEFEFSGAEVSEIDAGVRWRAYFVRLEKDFLIKYDGQILSYDVPDGGVVGGVRVIAPSSNKAASFIKNGHHYDVLTKDEYAVIIADEELDFRKCVIVMNGEKFEISSIEPNRKVNKCEYNIPLIFVRDNTCEFQVVDLERNRIISRHLFKLITGFDVRFDKEFYFAEEDYDNSSISVTGLQGVKNHCFGVNDENISISVDDGILEVKIPRVVVRDNAGEIWDNRKTIWIKDIRQEDKIYLSYPEGCHAVIKIGNFEVTEESTGTFGFGNAVFAYSDSDINSWIEVVLCLRGKYLKKDYKIGRISRKERFLEEVSFDYHNGDLFWNRGLGFLGNKNGKFVLRLSVADWKKEYPLDLEAEVAIASPQLPLGEYDYRIVKESENIFLGNETVLQEGHLVIGDENELRFSASMIEITAITYEEDGNIYSVDIRNTYINQIEYLGIQFSEERECPVYRGKMFYMGKSGNHHEFSSERMISDKGLQLYKINPVKIVFINEHTLSITDEDGDGIYYYRYFNKMALKNVYAITDREYTERTQDTYYLADLYTYRKVRRQ